MEKKMTRFKAPTSHFALITILGMTLLSASISAHALNLEGGIGASRYSVAGDNIWYDQTYPHDNRLRSTGLVGGASGSFSPRFGWRAWLVDFGQVSNSAVWPQDADYFAHDGAAPVYQGKGHGSAYGLSVGPTVDFRPAPSLELSVEAGAFLYRAQWQESVRQLSGGAWTDASTFSAAGPWQSGATYYTGVMVRSKAIFLSYRRYADVYARDGLFGNAVSQIVLGACFAY